MVTQINRTGYPKEMEERVEAEGVDFYGMEYFSGEDIVVYEGDIAVLKGEIIHQDNLQQFLEEELGLVFKSA
jgi:hypothetical protein